MKITTTSKQFSINLRDIGKGLLLAIVTPVLTVIIDTLNSGTLTMNWKNILITALSAGLAYILKNFFAPPSIRIETKAAVVEAVKQGEAQVKLESK